MQHSATDPQKKILSDSRSDALPDLVAPDTPSKVPEDPSLQLGRVGILSKLIRSNIAF